MIVAESVAIASDNDDTPDRRHVDSVGRKEEELAGEREDAAYDLSVSVFKAKARVAAHMPGCTSMPLIAWC